jgi:diguanylate cyclase (GGDEF)-like protein
VRFLEASLILLAAMAITAAVAYVYEMRVRRAAERRTRELALLNEIGNAVTSHLELDQVFPAIHQHLSQFLDNSSFYIAMLDEPAGVLRFEFETEGGQVLPKRERKITNGFSEHVIRTGRSLLIERDLESARNRLGVVSVARPAKSFCGVPIRLHGSWQGVMAVLHYEKEGVYDRHGLEVLEIAARSVSVAMENARLFAAEQRRSRYLEILNDLSRTAISAQNAEEMLGAIAAELQQSFGCDLVAVGVVDHAAKEIEISAEAGNPSGTLHRRIPLDVGLLGRAARSGKMVLERDPGGSLLSILPGARSVLCLPLSYGDSLKGLLDLESRSLQAFAEDEVKMLRTLADILSTALHNVYVFQKLEQQSITDPLTGIKTRRFFTEALQAEFKRGLRSGRPFALVLIDLDKFKEVNDTMGHLEGDLVLARIGQLLDQKVRQSNVVARYGGDEFVILMPETNVDQACVISERLRLWIATDPFLNERHITGSFGVAEYPLHGNSIEEIFRMADTGMYMSKRAGGNKVSTPEIVPEAVEHHEVRKIINSALEGLLLREHFASEDEIVSALRRIAAQVPEAEAVSALRQAVRAITRAVEARELHATGHGDTVASYVAAIAGELPFSPQEKDDLIFAAQVHDVGKIVVPESILTKPGTLTFEEYKIMQRHPAIGSSIVAVLPDSARIQEFVRHHQEHMNGAGYPDGATSAQISLGARVIAVAEAFVNMISDKPYAEGVSPGDALHELQSKAGTHFDPDVVRILARRLKGSGEPKPARV